MDTPLVGSPDHRALVGEIESRMTIGRGSSLALDESAREQQLRAEAERLRGHLVDEGFFEAHVRITERTDDRHQSTVTVGVSVGPPYSLGRIEVVGNTALETQEIQKMFRHDDVCKAQESCVQHFSQKQLLKDMQSLVASYQERGYTGVRIKHDYDPRQSFQKASRSVNLRIEIREQ